MLALYAPFIEANISTETLFGMGLLGMGIDGTWYVTVATVLSSGDGVSKLRAQARRIDAAMGVLMFVFAGLLYSGYL
jgi:threonine/homoserine/homoserine lactone efflux protein